MTAPFGDCKILNLYGDPIYVPKDLPQEKEADIRMQIKEALENIQKRLPDEYKEAKKNKLWDKLKK